MKSRPKNSPALACEWAPELGGLLLTIAEAWAVPVVAVDLSEGLPDCGMVPSPDVFRGCPTTACDRGFGDCFKEMHENRPEDWHNRSWLYAHECPDEHVILVAPFLLPGYRHGAVVCGCLPLSFLPLNRHVVKGIDAQDRLRPPISDASAPEALAVSFHSLRKQVEAFARTFIHWNELVDAADESQRSMASILKGLSSFLSSPDNRGGFLHALAALENIRAIGHLDVVCDRQGHRLLRHRWFAVCKPAPPELISKSGEKTVKDLQLGGVIRDRWDLSRTGHDCDLDLLVELERSDPVKRYAHAFREYLKGCKYVMIGRTGRKVAANTCDLNAQCEFRRECPLFVDEPATSGTTSRWRRRMVAIDLVFPDSSLPDDKVRLALLQMASLYRSLRTERELLEEITLRGLPQLGEKDQRHLLRYFFEHCKAMEDSQEKGAAFERLMLGLFSLVPGWMPGERGLHTRENELDLTILVEPAVAAAKFWFKVFGPNIVVECKNYPNVLKTERNENGEDQVEKFRSIMEKANVKLGLLVNTGRITKPLKDKAVELSRPDRLLVVLDGSSLSHLIDNPKDIEYSLKRWVANALMKAFPP